MRGRHAAKVEWVGNPLRDEITGLARPETRFAERTGPLRLLVVGGSLGAAALNRIVPAALALIPAAARPQVVHQSGAKHLESLQAAYRTAGVTAACTAFIADMAMRYSEADVVLCRGGAITVSELAAVGVASMIVPLPGAIADEQSANAQFLVDGAAAVRIPERELTPEALATRLQSFTRATLLAMAIAARKLARPDAANRVADACVELGARA
jgi:UDP-N-acetylglucosamine--N-acetylmuramyl-(pentapeptide) pyrophosphoryl-undecaprenol N-acetylglucosamine transferase